MTPATATWQVTRWIGGNGDRPTDEAIRMELRRLYALERERRLGNLPHLAEHALDEETREQARRLVSAIRDDGAGLP